MLLIEQLKRDGIFNDNAQELHSSSICRVSQTWRMLDLEHFIKTIHWETAS